MRGCFARVCLSFVLFCANNSNSLHTIPTALAAVQRAAIRTRTRTAAQGAGEWARLVAEALVQSRQSFSRSACAELGAVLLRRSPKVAMPLKLSQEGGE